MTLLYASPLFLEHKTGPHPEKPLRLATIGRHLEATGLDQRCRRPQWEPASRQELLLVHEADYLDRLEGYALTGGGRIEADTVVSERSFEVAALAAGAALGAVRQVLSGEDQNALCLVRPPGHHALADNPMGFCLLGNVAIAARSAIKQHGLDRVLIVDWDVHHGNGTQAMFWEDEQVGFLSIHRWPFYPGTGAADETGAGRGLGTKLNIPVSFGTPLEEFHAVFERGLADLAPKMKPQLILISAGFDAHRDDPIGSLQLETEDFERLTKTVMATANEYCGGRVVSVLEGGYHPQRLAESVAIHLEELLRPQSDS